MTDLTQHTLPIGYELEQRFRVEKLLGQGAFGATYLVTHLHFGTSHVVKEYLPDSAMRQQGSTVIPKSETEVPLFAWGLERFCEEAKLLYRLNHPNIVKVTDLFQSKGTAYFVMPYLGGFTFQNWIDAHPEPTEEELLSIFIPLLEGLKYIHGSGLLHRDIKPENILITDDNIPILIDFGSARNAVGKKSKLLTRVLTPHFAPIEQYSQNMVFTSALDLYSLAATIYQAIVGKYPPAAVDRMGDDPIIVLSDSPIYQQRYSMAFLQAIDKNLSFHAKDRDQSAFDMQNHLLSMYDVEQEMNSEPDIVIGSEKIISNDVDNDIAGAQEQQESDDDPTAYAELYQPDPYDELQQEQLSNQIEQQQTTPMVESPVIAQQQANKSASKSNIVLMLIGIIIILLLVLLLLLTTPFAANDFAMALTLMEESA